MGFDAALRGLLALAEPLSEGSNFLDVLPAWMLIHP